MFLVTPAVGAQIANLSHGQRADTSIDVSAIPQPQAAELLNVSLPSVQRARKVQEEGIPELGAAEVTGGRAGCLPAQSSPITPLGAAFECCPGSVKGGLSLDGFRVARTIQRRGGGGQPRFQPGQRASHAVGVVPAMMAPDMLRARAWDRPGPRERTCDDRRRSWIRAYIAPLTPVTTPHGWVRVFLLRERRPGGSQAPVFSLFCSCPWPALGTRETSFRSR